VTVNAAKLVYKAAGSTTSRSLEDRAGEIFNIRDYGAVGDFMADDTNAIREALSAMWNSGAACGTLWVPPGKYKVTDTIDVSNPNVQGSNTSGRIVGAGKGASYIAGTINNGFVLYQPDNTNGPEEFANFRVDNTSTWIGSGALLLNNSSAVIRSCYFGGMIGALLPFNIYDATFDSCNGNAWSDGTTGYTGTLGIAGIAAHVNAWRSTSPYQAAIQFFTGNTAVIKGCGIENCTAAIVPGMATGWAGSCTVSGNIFTVGGTLGTTLFPQFVRGAQIFGRGLSTTAEWGRAPNAGLITIVDDHGSDGTLTGAGGAGTYRISTTLGSPITTPIPVWSRYDTTCSGLTIMSLQTEACYYTYFLQNLIGGKIMAGGANATPAECVDAFGNPGYQAHSGLYLLKASATSISGIFPNNNPYGGSFFIDPNAVCNGVTFDSCYGVKNADNVGTGTISNGSGGAGTILNFTVASGSFVGIGQPVTGAGVSANTVVVGNRDTDGTLTGSGGSGTYRVNNSQNVASTTITCHTGGDWVMPTATSAKAGLKFVN
jgi:hypothetical protein